MSAQLESCSGVPREVLLFRHGDTSFLQSRRTKDEITDPSYIQLQERLRDDPFAPDVRSLAEKAIANLPIPIPNDEIPLTQEGIEQLQRIGTKLSNLYEAGELELPNVIFVSPTKRTRSTLKVFMESFSQLRQGIEKGQIQVIEDLRIREVISGESDLYFDKSLYFATHPEQLRERIRLGRRGRFEQRLPCGQNVPDKMAQMKDWNEFISEEFQDKIVWAITHNMAMISYQLVMEGFMEDEGESLVDRFLELSDYRNVNAPASMTIYERDCVNDPISDRRGRLRLQKSNIVLSE